VRVLAGPICQAEYNYWQVDYQGTIAWMAESDTEAYFTEPLGNLVGNANVHLVLPSSLGDEGKISRVQDKRPEDSDFALTTIAIANKKCESQMMRSLILSMALSAMVIWHGGR
jgi:hypothetical protein